MKGSVMIMQIKTRKAVETDWPSILQAANAAMPWAPRDNQEWLSNRMRFDQTGYVRRHYVALDGPVGNVIGYGAVEGGPEPGRYRIFVVMPPGLLTSAGDYLYDRLIADLSTLHATIIWAREYVRGAALLSFFSQRGFRETQRFPIPGSNEEEVVLEKHV